MVPGSRATQSSLRRLRKLVCVRSAGMTIPNVVIAGLDPAIHHFGIEIVFTMDARVKPGHDASGFLKLGIYSLHFLAERGRHVRRRDDDLGVRARFNLAGIILVARGFLDRL